jgi:hypothetical protein
MQEFKSGLENRFTALEFIVLTARNPLYLQKLTITSLASSGCSVGIVHLRTKAAEFSFLLCRNLKVELKTL